VGKGEVPELTRQEKFWPGRIRMPFMEEHDEKPESLDRCWDPDLEVLGEMLDQLEDEEAMNLEELDGFFAALACSPELVMPSEYLPIVIGPNITLTEAFPSEDALRLFLELVIHHWNEVMKAFATEDFFIPLLLEDEEGKAYGNSWAIGFMRGVAIREDAWKELLDNEDDFARFIPILALVHEHDSDPDMRPYKEPMTEERRESLLTGVAAMVTDMYRYFAPHRQRAAEVARQRAWPIKNTAKIGRNDPCYCGSGKKYKKCCGSVKVN
jgi:uncharacterized protein